MVTKEQIVDDDDVPTYTPRTMRLIGEDIKRLADENATLRAQLAECMAQVERMRTRLEFLSKLKGTP